METSDNRIKEKIIKKLREEKSPQKEPEQVGEEPPEVPVGTAETHRLVQAVVGEQKKRHLQK